MVMGALPPDWRASMSGRAARPPPRPPAGLTRPGSPAAVCLGGGAGAEAASTVDACRARMRHTGRGVTGISEIYTRPQECLTSPPTTLGTRRWPYASAICALAAHAVANAASAAGRVAVAQVIRHGMPARVRSQRHAACARRRRLCVLAPGADARGTLRQTRARAQPTATGSLCNVVGQSGRSSSRSFAPRNQNSPDR